MLLFPRVWILAAEHLGRLRALWSVMEPCLRGLEIVSVGPSHEILRKLEGLRRGLVLVFALRVFGGVAPDDGSGGCCGSSPKPKQTPQPPCVLLKSEKWIAIHLPLKIYHSLSSPSHTRRRTHQPGCPRFNLILILLL